ncbi:MAG: M48 family metalloprotease [Acidobacteriota bacterium]|nr:M48 family metalloprotease [Acidobacteriota bacterium]
MNKPRSLIGTLAVMLLVAALPLAAENKKDNVNDIGNRKVAGWSIISLQKEVAIGRQYADQIDHSAKLIKDPVVNEYVNRLAQNLARNSDAKVPVSVKVIDDPTINAFTLPGGFIYVDSGTILAADNEAQLAGVLAHEIGHVAERSWASSMTKRTLLQYAMIPIMFTPMSFGVYEGLSAAMNGIPIIFLKFSRGQEEGADFLGLQYMYKAGYDPDAYVAVFGKVLNEERESPGSVASIFADHPPTPDRIIKCEEEIKGILPNRQEYLLNTSEFEQMKGRLESDLTVHRKPGGSGQPTLERRQPTQTAGTPPPTTTPGQDSGDKPPVLKRKD